MGVAAAIPETSKDEEQGITAIITQHPLLKIALNDDGSLTLSICPNQGYRCPTCLQAVITGPDGDLVHQLEEGNNNCMPSVSVVISKAIIE